MLEKSPTLLELKPMGEKHIMIIQHNVQWYHNEKQLDVNR